jgi:hypothetical protein
MPIVPNVTTRKRGNQTVGDRFRSPPAEFDLGVKQLHLTPEMYVFSRELRG